MSAFQWLGAGVVGLLFAALGSIVWHSLRLGISPMPSSRKALRAMLSLVPESTTGPIAELGAGWGTLAFALSHHAKHAQVTAYERSPVPYAVMWLRQAVFRRPNLTLYYGDFAAAPLSEYAVVLCYLWPGAMTKVALRFERELRPGAVLVSNTFGLRGREAERALQLDDVYRTYIYRYVR